MDVTSVTSKGQVTIPKELRQALGIRRGTRIQFLRVGDRVEMRVSSSPSEASRVPGGGFGMLKSRRAAVPTDLDPASLLGPSGAKSRPARPTQGARRHGAARRDSGKR